MPKMVHQRDLDVGQLRGRKILLRVSAGVARSDFLFYSGLEVVVTMAVKVRNFRVG